MNPTSRRALLQGAGAAVGACCLGACSQPENTPSRGPGTIKTSEVPVGGGAIIEGSYYVVTQPTAGTYKAFTRVCPHAGQLVNRISDGSIICPGHGSHFSIVDGSKQSGPASRGLTQVTCTVKAGEITATG